MRLTGTSWRPLGTCDVVSRHKRREEFVLSVFDDLQQRGRGPDEGLARVIVVERHEGRTGRIELPVCQTDGAVAVIRMELDQTPCQGPNNSVALSCLICVTAEVQLAVSTWSGNLPLASDCLFCMVNWLLTTSVY